MATKTPIKAEKMVTTAVNGQTQQVQEIEKEPRRSTGNPWMRPLNPTMRVEPFPLDLPQGFSLMSDEFCFEKFFRTIIAPLGFKSEAERTEWLKLACRWCDQADAREKEAIARDLLSKATQDPQVLAFLKQQIAAA